MENKYYIHLNSNTLPHYLVDGIIRPANLIKNREQDFQNNSGNQIILSLKKWNKTSDCSIEVVLDNDENKALEKISTDFFLCHSAIPISRIKAIYFEDKEKADTVIWNINTTVAFVPNWVINYSDKEGSEIAEEFPFTYNTKKDQTKELVVMLKRFDRLLGGLAFLKVSAAINSKNKINFSKSYFSTLAYFNKKIATDIQKNNIAIDDRFHDIFKGDSRIFNYLAKQIDMPLIEEVSKQEGIQLKSKFGVIDLTSLPNNSLTFKLAILESFGKDSSKSVEDLINSLLSNLEEDISEEIALIYGLYVGYNTLRNYYKINDNKIQVKFDLNSKVDFYTLESLYQYTFNNKKISSDFDYLRIDFLQADTKIKRDLDYKYLKVLGDYYVYKKLDYKAEKEKVLDAFIREISKWFPTELFRINKEALSENMNSLIEPKLNNLIENVKEDIKETIELITLEAFKTDAASIDSITKENEENEQTVNMPTQDKSELKKINEKEPLQGKFGFIENENLDNPNQELMVDLSETKKPKLLNALELNILTIKKLEAYAKELKIQIPKENKLKKDIIKFILSNQE